MALTPGARLGPYEILSTLGAGGMGEVYRARDAKLHRDVALKILPDAFAADPDRLARFTREAQTLASLNHPNIAHIHGLEESGGVRALVMELVEGEDLAERIARGPMPFDETLPMAKQIAEALEAAHEKGIIHRDLKPANIKITPDGTVKVLDFGLAKLHDPNASNVPNVPKVPNAFSMSPTITSPAMMTGPGMILGTAAYMAPEQARGKAVDTRADIWAFGCVLYEMLTGRRAFADEDVALTLSNVLRRDPDFAALPDDVPLRVGQTLRVCLQRDLRQRVQAIGDVRLALEGAFDTAGARAVAPVTIAQPAWRRAAPATAAAVLTGLVVGLGMWALTRPIPPLPVQLTLVHPGPEVLGGNLTDANTVISPDGRRIAYVASAPDAPFARLEADYRASLSSSNNTLRLYIRALGQREPTLLSTSARTPFFSPDGQWVGFVEGNSRLSKVALTGGPSFPIGVIGNGIRGASWGADDTIVFATEVGSTGLLRIPAAGGKAEVLTAPDLAKGEIDHLYPDVLPGARSILFTIENNQGADHSQIAVLDLETRTWRVLIQGGSHARYVASGHIVYGAAGTLRAVAFDLGRLDVRGPPVPVLDSVVTKPSGAASFSVSFDGTLVYVRGRATAQQQTLVWVDRNGREEPLGMEPRLYSDQALSPDRTRVAVTVDRGDGIEADVWVWSLLRRTMTPLTLEPGEQRFPLWTPDGTRIVYASGQQGLFWRPADGTGVAERLLDQGADTRVLVPDSWSADGRLLFAKQDRATGSWDLGVLQVAGDRTATPLLADPAFDESWASVSPDGRWVAYESFESGRPEIYVRPFPSVEAGKWQVSSGGGQQPKWSDVRTLFFYGAVGVMTTTIQTVPTFASAPPERAVSREGFVGSYDVSRDGARFLMLKHVETARDDARPELNVILNWVEELKRLVP